ncbi:hypothetical protein IV203_005650 [Nitzschia inconspicua]|uniref:Reverse transcriptase zinc-binding domain-containing protein n=1 Tax=Nitzschia inconspicua TaxID=303405 RepID=A0A9K3KMU7_9STRA|nr:hypothetical protein IV203_005650 [Nitzschia inconspicua]
MFCRRLCDLPNSSRRTFHHIKGHQDTQVALDKLSRPAKLNVQADKLARNYQRLSSHKNIPAPMIEGTHCHLIYNGQTIASKHRKHIRDHRRTKKLKTYIQQKTQMSEAAFADIDWQSHERSVHTFKDGPHIFLVKFLHGWLPVGKLVSRYDPIKYPSACPSCDEPSEDSKHYLACPNPERRKWHAALKTSLRHRCESADADPALLLWGLNHWLQGTPIPAHRIPERIAHLLHSQTTIGWYNFLLGRWSKHWTTLQLQYLQRYHIEVKNKNHGLSLSSNIDEVFHLIRTAPPDNLTPTMASRQRTPTQTTRPINTYFLPHRITPPTPTMETTTTTARTTSTSNNPTTIIPTDKQTLTNEQIRSFPCHITPSPPR